MTLDPLILSRIQFVWVIGWHILLPAFTIGLASFIAAMEGAHLITGREILFRISSFSIKIFSVAFGMGVVSGIVMPFQFGTNWSRYSEITANVLAPLFAYEGIVGVLPGGCIPRRAAVRPQPGAALGAFRRGADGRARYPVLGVLDPLLSNSWMQTPAGYTIRRRPLRRGRLASPSSSTRLSIGLPYGLRRFTSLPASWC